MQTIQQIRAKFALNQVQTLLKKYDSSEQKKSEKAKFKARACSLPAMIVMNGLGQTAAFCKSKKDKDGYGDIYTVLEAWLGQVGQPYHGKELIQGIISGDMHSYRQAQAEALAYLSWVKKFASAYVDDIPEEGATS